MKETAANNPDDEEPDPIPSTSQNPRLPTGKMGDFDLAQFRVSQERFAGSIAQKVITTVPVGKPAKNSFFRTHPDDDYRVKVGVVELPTTRETYLVLGSLCESLEDEPAFKYRLLITCVTRSGSIVLWPVQADATHDWARSAHEIAELAKSKWLRLKANMEIGAYEPIVAVDQTAQPAWSELSFKELITRAFKGRIIDSYDHPVLRELRGES